MSIHRHPVSSLSNKPPHRNGKDGFTPGGALESLYADLIQVDAFAHAASEAIVELRAPSNRAERRTFARIHTLVTKAADEARAALLHGDTLVAALSAHMAARRARQDTGSTARGT